MMTPEPSGDGEFELSPDARAEVALAIGAFVSSRATDGDARMQLAVARVSTEARQRAASPEQMIRAIQRLFERAPRISGDVHKRVEAYDLFVRRCVEALNRSESP